MKEVTICISVKAKESVNLASPVTPMVDATLSSVSTLKHLMSQVHSLHAVRIMFLIYQHCCTWIQVRNITGSLMLVCIRSESWG